MKRLTSLCRGCRKSSSIFSWGGGRVAVSVEPPPPKSPYNPILEVVRGNKGFNIIQDFSGTLQAKKRLDGLALTGIIGRVNCFSENLSVNGGFVMFVYTYIENCRSLYFLFRNVRSSFQHKLAYPLLMYALIIPYPSFFLRNL